MIDDLRMLSLFAGIGGFECAFQKAGYTGPVVAYENWDSAQAVLRKRFPGSELHDDVRGLPSDLHGADIVVAGFPCTDLSPAGRAAGISGEASGLIVAVLETIQKRQPEWVLLENVPNMLRLKGGEAMAIIGEMLSSAGYNWAYRILDAQYFGVAQRRKRVFILASRHGDPSRVLFRDYSDHSETESGRTGRPTKSYGFYWTEGNRGVGWGDGVVPTIKGSTTAGIPSSPAVWLPEEPQESRFRTPSIASLETLQGFRPGWTAAAPSRDRWKLVGNAVAVPAVQWIAEGLLAYEELEAVSLPDVLAGPRGWGTGGMMVDGAVWKGTTSDAPLSGSLRRTFSLHRLLQERGSHPLSSKATAGFVGRLQRSSLRYQKAFMDDLLAYSSQ